LTSQPANKQTDRRDKTAGQDSTRHQITKSSRRQEKWKGTAVAGVSHTVAWQLWKTPSCIWLKRKLPRQPRWATLLSL